MRTDWKKGTENKKANTTINKDVIVKAWSDSSSLCSNKWHHSREARNVFLSVRVCKLFLQLVFVTAALSWSTTITLSFLELAKEGGFRHAYVFHSSWPARCSCTWGKMDSMLGRLDFLRTSSFGTKLCHLVPRMECKQRWWNGSSSLICCRWRTQVSASYRRVRTMTAPYTWILVERRNEWLCHNPFDSIRQCGTNISMTIFTITTSVTVSFSSSSRRGQVTRTWKWTKILSAEHKWAVTEWPKLSNVWSRSEYSFAFSALLIPACLVGSAFISSESSLIITGDINKKWYFLTHDLMNVAPMWYDLHGWLGIQCQKSNIATFVQCNSHKHLKALKL